MFINSIRLGNRAVFGPESESVTSIWVVNPFFNLLDMANSDAWNCLSEIEHDKDLVQSIVEVIIKNTSNAIERLFYSDSFRIGKAVLPRANVRSRLWDLDAVILQSVEGKLRSNQRDVRNSTAYTMAVIFNTICETHSDVLVAPYLNGAGGPPEPR